MDRQELGERLLQWHGSMSDPVYAVGSFYIDGSVYPDKEIVQDATNNLTRDLEQFQCMLKGDKVMVERGGQKVDLKVFAGCTNDQLQEHISDLEEIVDELQLCLTEDYSGG